MQLTSFKFDEDLRLEDLYAYDILDTDEEKDFDDILEIATQVSGCPMAAIAFIDKDRQWLKAKVGVSEKEIPRNLAFCSHTILQSEIFLVNDTTKDKRFVKNPLVAGDPHIRFYAGAPVISEAGLPLGTVCILDQKPRKLNEDQQRLLVILSAQVSKLLQLRLKTKILQNKAAEEVSRQVNVLRKSLAQHEEDRYRWGSVLHETIAQGLVATKFYLELAEQSDIGKNGLLQKSKSCVGTLLHQVTELSAALTPSTLNIYDLKELIAVLLNRFQSLTNIKTSFVFEGNSELGAEISMTIYRIVEDQLDNIKQHAAAGSVSVAIHSSDTIYLSVKDDGVGADETKLTNGLGMSKMISRIERYNGRVDVHTKLNEGYELSIILSAIS